MIELPTLYDHQAELRDHVRKVLAKRRRVILSAPPGVGKTRLAKWILGAGLQRDPRPGQTGRGLFTVHRRSLVQNAVDSFSEAPELPHGVIMSDRPTAYGQRIQVASIDTLLSWFVENDRYPSDVTFDLIIWDECHSHHNKFARFLKAHDARREELHQPPAYVIGLSATPRGDGLADVYGEIVLGPPTKWLIENKFLSPFRYFRATEGRLDALKKVGGEFTKGSVADAMGGLSGDLVRDWEKFGQGRPTVGFFPRRSHAQEAQQLLEQAGLLVDYVDGETSDDDRKRMFDALNSGRIHYLCNVQVVERGTDIPAISCVQLGTAIGSLVRYLQMIGRGSRIAEGKDDCIVIDHGGNVLRHGFFEDEVQWSLDNSSKQLGEQGQRPKIECPRCQAVYRGGLCRNCGYEPSRSERASQGLEFDGAELVEVKQRERQAATTKTAEEIMVSALYTAGRARKPMTFRQACGIFLSKCKQFGVNYRVPHEVTVGNYRYALPIRGSEDGSRQVRILFPFTANRGEHGGKYLVEDA